MMASWVTKNVPPSFGSPAVENRTLGVLNVISVPIGRICELALLLHTLMVKGPAPGNDGPNVVFGPSKVRGVSGVGQSPASELQPPPQPVPSVISAPLISDGSVPLVALVAVPQLLALNVLSFDEMAEATAVGTCVASSLIW